METYAENGFVLPTAGIKRLIRYYYYFIYIPKNHMEEVPKKYQTRRHITWNFKNGKESETTANELKEDIELLNLDKPLSDWWLCVIPASTQEANKKRFKKFCETFCMGTEINNGYELITVKEDREARHLAEKEEKDKIGILDTIDFKDIKGKKILLFDDMITSGKSFLKVAGKLKSLGADKIVGLFLSKSFWPETIEELEK